jgi:hypothetical protein
MVFCEVKCRHNRTCEALIAADRPHPEEGALYVHTSTNYATGEVHTWRTRPATLMGKGACQVTTMPHPAKLNADKLPDRTITVRVRK